VKRSALAAGLAVAAVVAFVFARPKERLSSPVARFPRSGPTVLEARPTGILGRPEPITALFDRPMISAQEVGTRTSILEIHPPLRGEAVWISEAALEFRPEELEPGTTYEARIPIADYRWTFRTPGLEVLQSRLETVDGRCAPDAPLFVRFSHAVAVEDLVGHVSFPHPFTVRAQGSGFELRSSTPLPQHAQAQWILRRGLRSGRLSLESDHVQTFQVCGPLTAQQMIGRASPEYGTSFTISTNYPLRDRLPRVRTSPPHELTASRSWRGLTVTGPFVPGRQYVVTLEDLEDRFGNRIDSVTLSGRIPDYVPDLDLGSDRAILERRADARFPVRFVNLRQIKTRTYVAPAGQELRTWISGQFPDGSWETRRIADEPNQVLTLGFPMEIPGVVLFEATAGSLTRRAKLQVTDLAIHAKQGSELLIWTTTLSSGRPTSAAISVHDEQGRTLWMGATLESGLVSVPPLPRAAHVFARSGDDVSILDLEEDAIPSWRYGVETSRKPSTKPLVQIVTDRGIYRPGDTARIRAILRRSTPEGLLPVTDELEVTVQDPRDRTVWNQRIRPSKYGTLDVSFRHRERDSLGTYSVLVGKEWAGSFRVESYRPAPFEVHVRAGQRTAITARYFFGASVSGSVEWEAAIEEIEFHPPGHGDFVFGDSTRRPSAIEHRPRSKTRIEGSCELLVPVSSSRVPRELTLEATVTDAGHQSVEAVGRTVLHSSDFYLGLRPEARVGLIERDLSVFVVAVSPEGSRRSAPARISVFRREWHTVAKRAAGGAITYRSEPVDEIIEEGMVWAPGFWRFRPLRSGTYLIAAESGSARTVAEVSVAGFGLSGWQMRDDLRLRLISDRASYRPGEVARILVPSPFAEADALVTVEREGVLDVRTHRLGSSSMIEVPIESRYAPNVFVSVLVVQGRTSEGFTKSGADLGRPTYRLGYLSLPVLDESRRIDLRVVADRPIYSPRQEVALEVASSRPAEVTVMVVDEAVLALTGHDTPDPLAFFSKPRPLGVRSAESRRCVLARTSYDEFGKKGAPGGGGGSKEGAPRSRFVPTAFFHVEECGGHSLIRFALPDNITRYRIMVFAVGKGDAYGRTESAIVVRQPLVLTSALPRFAREGDAFEARVLVQNGSGDDGEVRVDFRDQTRTASVRNGETAAVSFPLRAERRGVEKLSFRAILGDHRDALEIELPILPSAPVETRILQGQSGGTFSVSVPLEQMEVTISGSPLAELECGLRYLLEYPHGCIEQTTSRTLPLLAVRWGEDGPLLPLVSGDVRPFAQAGLDRILSMQTDGGFAYWPGGSRPHPWGTVYGTHAIALGFRQGYDVPAPALRRALDDLSKVLRTEASVTVRAYAVWVLSLAARPEPGYVDALCRRPDLTRTARAFLALAGGSPGPARARDEDDVYSDLEPALELMADPRRLDLAREILAERREGRWPKTTQNSFAILALASASPPATRAVHVRTPFGETRVGPPLRYRGSARDFTIESTAPVYWSIRATGPSRETRRLDRGISLLREIPQDIRAGDLVTVRLRVIVRHRARYVAVEDPLPAGLEPLLEEAGSHAERRDDRIQIYADDLSPGVHDFRYRLRATTPGAFVHPPARAERMYRPEVFGTTDSGVVRIR